MLARLFQFPFELAWFGPLYSTIMWRIRAPRPLDPTQNWNFWTRHRLKPVRFLVRHYPIRIMRSLILRSALREDHERGIHRHYDLSSGFFELFLDQKFKFYSCADFCSPGLTLEEAQSRKAESLLGLIQPESGLKILDLGCGWGGMMNVIASCIEDKENIMGFTLSENQQQYVQNQLGLRAVCRDFINTEYSAGSWDRIYSIGAWEHVKPAEILPLLRKLHRALKPNGKLVHHFFCLNRKSLPTLMIAGQVFFPGSLLVSWEEQREAFQKTGFRIRRHTTHDYRPTLEAWYWNLARNEKEAIEIAGLENYNRFLTFFPVSWRFFNEGYAQVHRVLLLKSD